MNFQLNIRSRRAWCYGCNSEVTPSHAVIGGNSSCAVVGGETVDKFGKLLKPKPTDHFVAKPPPDLGSGEQVLTEFIPYSC
jgi:hypothetical protein